MNYLASDSCSFCHLPLTPNVVTCRRCGHQGRFPQLFCECITCRYARPPSERHLITVVPEAGRHEH